MSFHIRTQEGYVIKVLSELLHNNIKIGCFEITPKGLFFRQTDTHGKICIDIALNSDNFEQFKVNLPKNETRILLGVNLAHLKKMLRPVKKKETIELIKESEESNDLCIKISPKELGGEVDVNFIKIQEIQILDLALPTGYGDYISIPTARYQKMCKDMESISQNIHIESNSNMIKFTSDMSGVYSRSILFGQDDSAPPTYSQIFESDQLNNLGRISGLGATTNSNIQIFTKEKLPILLRTNIGTLGKLNIYIKSREQLESEKILE